MIYALPFIAALTGWVTNWVAVKMLFHPREPKNFGFFKVQGVFPKRQKLLAEKLGDVVANELFSIDDVVNKMKEADNSEVLKFVELKLDNFINNKIGQEMPMLAMFLNDDIKAKIKGVLLSEIQEVIPGVVDSYANKLKNDINVKEIVYKKVVNFSSNKLEKILYSIMKKEFKFIEILGAILGFIIGIIQVILIKF